MAYPRRRKKPPTLARGFKNPFANNNPITGAGNTASGVAGGKGGGGGGNGYSSAGAGVSSLSSGVGTATGTSPTSTATSGVSSVSSGVSSGSQKSQAAAPLPTTSSPLSTVTTEALGLSQTEAGLVPYVLDAAAQNRVSPAMLMGLIENQSGFKPSARLGAERGLGMFGPDSSRAYDVKHGEDPAAIKSQVDGLAAMLSDADVNKDPIGALNMWSRGDHGDFAERVMAAAQKFRPLDEALKPLATRDGLTKAVQTAQAARAAGAGLAAAGVAGERTAGGWGDEDAIAVAHGQKPLAADELRAAQGAAALGQTALAAQNILPGQDPAGPRPRKVALALEKAVAKSAPKSLEQYADLGPAAPELAAAAVEYGKEFGIDPSFLMAIAEVETGFGAAAGSGSPGAGAVSSAGAQGYMQFMPESRDTVLRETGYDAFSKDPKEAMAAAAGYFSVFAPDAKDNWDRAFSYNHAGWYADDVTARAQKYKELDGAQVASREVPQGLVDRAKNVLGKPAAKAILAGGQVIRDPKAGAGSGPVDVTSARQEIKAGAIVKLKPNEEKFFSYDPNTDRAWFDPVLKQQLIALSKESGEPIQLNSGFRTLDEQKAAFADYQAGGATAATPGSSNHEFGLAADLQLTDRQRSLLPKFGLGLPVPGEDWHVEVVDPDLKAKQTAVNLGTAGGSATVSGENPNIPVKGKSPLAVEPAAPTEASGIGGSVTGTGTTLTGGTAPSSGGSWTPMQFSRGGQEPPRPMVSTADINVPNMAAAVLPKGFGGDFSGMEGGDLSPEEQSLIDQLVAAAKPKNRIRTR